MLVYGVSFSSAGLVTDCMLFLKVQHHECSFVPHLLILPEGLRNEGKKKKKIQSVSCKKLLKNNFVIKSCITLGSTHRHEHLKSYNTVNLKEDGLFVTYTSYNSYRISDSSAFGQSGLVEC